MILFICVVLFAERGVAQTPGEVVKEFFKLANQGNYAEIEKYLSDELRAILEMGTAFGASKQQAWQKATRNGTLEKLEIVKEEVNTDSATVYSTMIFKDGSTEADVEDLVKQNGRWKITNDKGKQQKRAQERSEQNAIRLLKAIQTDDFQAIFDLNSFYQEEVARIHKENPKVLWPKLTKDYYERERQSYMQPATGTFRGAMFLLRARPLVRGFPMLQVNESRLQMATGLLGETVTVYVAVQYKTVGDSPAIQNVGGVIGQKRLKSTLLELVFGSGGALFYYGNRVEKGDVFWDEVALEPDAKPVSAQSPTAGADLINCIKNLEQVGLAFRLWAFDNGKSYPFNVSTNKGGTLECCDRDLDGFDRQGARHVQVLVKLLGTPKVFVCPADTSKEIDSSPGSGLPAYVSYQVRSGPQLNDQNPKELLARCPIHGTRLLCDGSTQLPDLNNEAGTPNSAWVVIERAIQVMGGKEALARMKCMHTKSEGVMLGSGSKFMNFAVETFYQLPDKLRNQVTMDRMNQVLVVNGSQGWERVGLVAKKLSSGALAEAQEGSYGGYLLLAMASGDRSNFDVALLEDSVADGQGLLMARVTSKGHPDVVLVFDKTAGFLVRRAQRLSIVGGGHVMEETSYADYKDFRGFKFATKFSVKRDGVKYAEMKLLDAELSAALDSSLFTKP